MGLPATTPAFTLAEYLAWEADQADKHEYLNGEVFAMGGAARAHVTAAGNVFNELSNRLEDTPCRVYMADMKLEVVAAHAIFYPDVLVTCDPADHRADLVLHGPILIVEVLSPSTAAFDRGDKFRAYRRIESLREYVLIDPTARSIEVFRRHPGGYWLLADILPEAPWPLESLELEIPWGRVFRNLD